MDTRLFKRIGLKVGTAPGTLLHVGDQKVEHPTFTVVEFDEATIQVQHPATINEALMLCDGSRMNWLNVDGIHDAGVIANIGEHFKIHPLTLEDILHTTQRPKQEIFEDYIYIVLQMLQHDPDTGQVVSEQVSLVLTANMLISFQESVGDVFAPVRDRLSKGRGRIRSSACDYLAYALIDAIVDHYFVILEFIGTKIEDLEEETIETPKKDVLERIHALKREVIFLRKQIWPLREVIAGLSKQASPLITENTAFFLRDVYDHAIQVIETIESYRDLLSSLIDLYLSNVSNRMNEVMKVLTLIATIFIPLTFIAGVYGMNFKHMPELDWPWAYGAVWCLMAAIAIGLLIFFRKKNWL